MAEDTTEGKERRRTKVPMTEGDKAALREFLLGPTIRKDGKIDLALAARLTGRTYNSLYNFVEADPYMKAQLPEVNAEKVMPTEVDLIDSKRPPGVFIDKAQWEEIQRLYRQQKRLEAKDWEALGLSAEQGARMEKMGNLGRAPLFQVTSTIYGQLIKDLANLDEILEKDARMIIEGTMPKEVDAKGDVVEMETVSRDWRYCYYQGVTLRLNVYTQVHKVSMLLLRAMREAKEIRDNDEGPGMKGVFAEPPVSERQPDPT